MGCGRSSAPAVRQPIKLLTRISCRDGCACTNWSAEHRVKFAHPGDHDYVQSSAGSGPPAAGADRSSSSSAIASRDTASLSRTACKYGGECKDFDDDHRKRYSHPGDLDWNQKEWTEKQRLSEVSHCHSCHSGGLRKACKFGLHCFRRNSEHVSAFAHPGDRDYRIGLITFEEGVHPEFETLRQLFDFCDPREHGNFSNRNDLQQALQLLAAHLPTGSLPSTDQAWRSLGGDEDLHVGFVRWAMWAQELGAKLPIGVETSPVEMECNHLSCGFEYADGRRCECKHFTCVADTATSGVHFCKCGHKRSMHAWRSKDGQRVATSAMAPLPNYWPKHCDATAELAPLGEDARAMFQRLFDQTHKERDNWTRDRGCSLHGLHCPKDQKNCALQHKSPVPHGYTVVGVMRNVNRRLWAAYALNRGAITKECETATGGQPFKALVDVKTVAVLLEDAPNVEACNEWFLFHGSSPSNCTGISSNGFKLSLAGTGCTWKDAGVAKGVPLYGDGLYFAESVTKADEYSEMVQHGQPFAGCHTILVCRVLGGRVQWCDTDKIDPALLQKQVISGPFHSVFGDRVTKLGKPYREVVVYDATQVYPEYLVYYRRLWGSG